MWFSNFQTTRVKSNFVQRRESVKIGCTWNTPEMNTIRRNSLQQPWCCTLRIARGKEGSSYPYCGSFSFSRCPLTVWSKNTGHTEGEFFFLSQMRCQWVYASRDCIGEIAFGKEVRAECQKPFLFFSANFVSTLQRLILKSHHIEIANIPPRWLNYQSRVTARGEKEGREMPHTERSVALFLILRRMCALYRDTIDNNSDRTRATCTDVRRGKFNEK